MIVVGLTGGIASGKTFVAKYLKELKIPTHESDEVVRTLYKKKEPPLLIFLRKEGFKTSILKDSIDKKKIRQEILTNNVKRKKLENFLHNEVKKDRDIFLKKNRNKKMIFLDIPLLFEKKLFNICDYVCSTIAPLKLREERALKRPNMDKKTFKMILKIQITDSLRKKKSNYIIDTSKTKKKTCLQIDNMIYCILKDNK